MNYMKTIELFSGTKSFSKVAESFGHSTFTIDFDGSLNPDVCCSIFDFKDRPQVDILWASPPCQGFSVAVIGRNWNHDKTPKTDSARNAMLMVKETMKIIDEIKPTYWFIENPRGMLRKMDWLDEWVKQHGGVRHTVTYCQYGDTRMKPTDIWTNCLSWNPKQICSNGAPCHIASPRGSRTGTQGLANAKDRGVIPPMIFEEIFQSIKL